MPLAVAQLEKSGDFPKKVRKYPEVEKMRKEKNRGGKIIYLWGCYLIFNFP